ncbi:MAG TPA: ABC-type transport auxiliary lipoprotein family protein, partial [Myxococcota bacterium]|nr:ABC-type transport auxiliary lipoprotein family protein [Myxococcota bacterium]
RPQIVYRQSPFEFQYYVYQLWAAKPQHMLRELVQSHLESTRLVAEVTRDFGERYPDYELVAEVLAIEEYDSSSFWYGHLAMRFELIRFSDKMPLWNYDFDRKRKVYDKQPVYVVRTLSQILSEEMVRVTAELDRVISADRGVQPTLALPPPPIDDESPQSIQPRPRQRVRAAPAGDARAPGTPAPAGAEDDLIVPDEPADGDAPLPMEPEIVQ